MNQTICIIFFASLLGFINLSNQKLFKSTNRGQAFMYSIYRLKSNELDNRFLESLKALFRGGKELEVIVSEIEPEYSSPNKAERKSVLEAIEEDSIRSFT